MENQYNDFAYVYDRLMEDVDYIGWSKYIQEIFNRKGLAPKKIVELACGTGNITLPLAEKGFEMMAVDLSQDMLMVAKEKAINKGLDILFIEQDMTQLEIEGQYEAVICMCDGINYILDEEDLQELFTRIYNHLSDEGVLIFDISTYYKLKEVLGENTFGENQGDLCYLWENYFDHEENILEMNLAFFLQEGNHYRKFEEFHQQRAYHRTELEGILREIGFNAIECFHQFSFEPPQEDSDRIFFVCSK